VLSLLFSKMYINTFVCPLVWFPFPLIRDTLKSDSIKLSVYASSSSMEHMDPYIHISQHAPLNYMYILHLMQGCVLITTHGQNKNMFDVFFSAETTCTARWHVFYIRNREVSIYTTVVQLILLVYSHDRRAANFSSAIRTTVAIFTRSVVVCSFKMLIDNSSVGLLTFCLGYYFFFLVAQLATSL
jgi:hypothetical protein